MPRMLGKRPPIPGRAAVPFGAFVTKVPEHPLDVAPIDLSYPMDHNDIAGDCVVAGLDHTLQVISAALGVDRSNWNDATLLRYYQTQNPHFTSWAEGGTSVDQGMIIQTFLEFLVAQGEILAFGKIDHTNVEELRAATYIGLAIVTGEDLQVAQQDQLVWDYVRGSGDWGGHCTCTVGYGGQRQICVTWGTLQPMTDVFVQRRVDEAWFVLTRAHLQHPEFRNHYDLAGFAAAVSDLTDGKVVVPTGPAPAPTPDPGAASFLDADPVLAARVDRAAARAGLTREAWLLHRLRTYFRL